MWKWNKKSWWRSNYHRKKITKLILKLTTLELVNCYSLKLVVLWDCNYLLFWFRRWLLSISKFRRKPPYLGVGNALEQSFWKNQAALKPSLRFSTNKKLKESQCDLTRLLKLPLSLVCLRRSFLFAKSLLVLPVKAKAYVVRERMFTLWMSFNSVSKNDTAFWILWPLP